MLDGGWQRVNTGISPNGQADYTGVDEGGDGTGAGQGLNQFYAVYTLPTPASTVTVSNNGTGGSNMISLVAVPVAADCANALGAPTEVNHTIGTFPTFNNRDFGNGAVDKKDATFIVDVDFDAHPGGERQLIFETGGGTVGWSLVYEEGNKIVARKVGRGGNNLSTLEYTLSQDEIDGGDIQISVTYDVVVGTGNAEHFLLIGGNIVAREEGDFEPDWTGGNGGALGVASTAVAAAGGNTNLTAADFTAGAINADKGLRFYEGVASEPTDGVYNGIGLGLESASPLLGSAVEFTGGEGSSNIDFGTFGKNHLAQLSNIDNQTPVPPGDPNTEKKTSVEFWLQTNQTSGNADNWRSPVIFGEESPGDGDIQWGWVTNDGEMGFAINDAGGAILRGPVINDDQWHHIVQTFDWTNNQYQLYLDGVLAQEVIVGGNIFQDADGGLIRYLGWNSRVDAGAGAASPHVLGQFVGKLDEVAIYDQVLSAEQVSNHFGAGSPKPNRVTVSIDGTVIHNEVDVGDFVPTAADRISFAARTGGATETLLLDNICVVPGTELPLSPGDPLVADPDAVPSVPLLAADNTVVGGQLVGDAFEIGVSGTAGGVNNWPGGEAPENAINGEGQKYLNFGELNTGIVVSPAGDTIAKGLKLWAANDAVPRDPASYSVYGTNADISGGIGAGSLAVADFTLISAGDLALPDSRNGGGATPLDDANAQTVEFANSDAYSSYMIVFPTVKDEAGANSMQIAEIQLLGRQVGAPLLADSDSDGVLDNQERVAGTDPFDSRDFFHMSDVSYALTDGQPSLHFGLATKPGSTYVLQFSPTMRQGTWENVDILTAEEDAAEFEVVNPRAFQLREGYFRAILVELNYEQ